MSPCESSLSTTASSGLAPIFTTGSNVNTIYLIRRGAKEQKQMYLCSNPIDPEAPKKLDVALANMVHSKGLDFNLPQDALMKRVLDIARTCPDKYTPPDRNRIVNDLLDHMYDTAMNENLDKAVDEGDEFGLIAYGNLATIVKHACVNFLVSSANNPFGIMDFIDCSEQCAAGKKKDAEYLAAKYIPLIKKLEDRPKIDGKKTPGIVDLVVFDGATNVQKASQILAARYPRITVLHGAGHVMGLVFSDIFK